MIGLKRRTVILASDHAEWAAVYARESATLRRAAGEMAVDIAHVGSTAIFGLPAKPIVDIAVTGASSDNPAPLVRAFEGIGYLDRGDDGGYLMVKEISPEVRLVHLHVVTTDDPQWAAYLAFRDRLRADAGMRSEYAALKSALVGRFRNDRDAYTAGKAAFIRRVISPP